MKEAPATDLEVREEKMLHPAISSFCTQPSSHHLLIFVLLEVEADAKELLPETG